MFRTFTFSLLAVAVFYTIRSTAQPFIPERNQLPPVQYRTIYPAVATSVDAGPGVPRLTGRARYLFNGDRFGLADSQHYRYADMSGTWADGSPKYSEHEIRRSGPEASGIRNRRSFQSYTPDGSPDVYLQQRWDSASASWIDLCRQSFSYRGGLLLRDTTWNWDQTRACWVPAACADYLRDGAGHAARVIIRSRNTATCSLDSAAELRYAYNASGQVVECISRYGAGRLRPSGRQTVSYSDEGFVTGTYYQRWDSLTAAWKADRGFRFLRGSRNERLMQEEVYWNALRNDWSRTSRSGAKYRYEYDAAGMLIAMTCADAAGSGSPSERYEYRYNELGQLVSARHLLSGKSSGKDQTLAQGSETILFYYEPLATGRVSDQPGTNLRIWPVPATDRLHIDVHALAGRSYRASIVDMQGRSLKSWTRPAGPAPTETLNIGGLLPGSYNLLIRSADGRSYSSPFSVVR